MDRHLEAPEGGDGVQRAVAEYIRDVLPPPEDTPALEYVFEALAHPRRRRRASIPPEKRTQREYRRGVNR